MVEEPSFFNMVQQWQSLLVRFLQIIFSAIIIFIAGLRSGRNIFEDSNSAMYGPFWATQGIYLTTANTSINVTTYDSTIDPIYIDLEDYFGQKVLYESVGASRFVSMRPLPDNGCNEQQGYYSMKLSHSFL